MPPKKTKAAGTPARQPAMRKEKTMCDLCCAAVVEGKEEALQCEGECQLWFHRYCAGVSSSYFKELSSSSKPFVCLPCAHKTQQAVVSTLQSELAALRVEMDELRAALDRARETPVNSNEAAITALTTEVQQLKSVVTTVKNLNPSNDQTGGKPPWNEVVRRGKRKFNAQQAKKGRRPSSSGIPRNPPTTSATNAEPRIASAGSVRGGTRQVVSGARRVWGTLRSASNITIRNTISHLTKLSWASKADSLQVKRKVATHTTKARWWFVLHGDEGNMKALENAWEMVKLQTGWRLEQCTKPSDVMESPATSACTQDNGDVETVEANKLPTMPSNEANIAAIVQNDPIVSIVSTGTSVQSPVSSPSGSYSGSTHSTTDSPGNFEDATAKASPPHPEGQ